MKTLLLVIAFIIQPDGSMQTIDSTKITVESRAECDRIGNNYRQYVDIPDNIRTISMCVSEDEF